ncbi:GLUT4 regulating protein TUG-domain-containing protein [Parachaetomium inaequale]|uniref:GLUT4 regulating protein TUG-domain-containing protein n=1 Tax=Parachaetomium inaequale TaxID=2588326 RepID=A0AAN6PEY6_9PEZI|nr:GLUT4 regulating protein TUG-domain-containing protein [Parachaetomium inaequale]
MSAHVEVVSTDLRRAKVKVSPGTYLVDVLAEACKKLNLKSDKYELKHKQKLVDLTGPFRTSGLSPGAKLELVQKSKSASVVSIALDVNGQRYTKKLPSDLSLWKVMRQFENAEKGLNITGRGVPVGTNSGQLYHDAPVVNIMGREYSAMEDLQKTLSQCGINSGSIVLRVTFKLGERTLYDAMQQIAQYLNEVEPEQPKAEGEAEPGAAPAAEQPKTDDTATEESAVPEATAPASAEEAAPSAPAEPSTAGEAMEVDGPPAETPTPGDPLQPTGVFTAPTSSTPAAARTHEDDSVYEPTIAHAQLRQQQLLQRSQNTRLKSDAELAAEAAAEAAQLAKITQVELKVRFPDQTSAVWTITPEETGTFLYQAIRNLMAHPAAPFKLILPGPKTAIQESDKRLIAGYRLKGREMLHLLWDDAVAAGVRREPFLKGSVASRAREVVVPEIPQGVAGEEGGKGGAGGAGAAGSSGQQQVKRDGGSGLDSDVVKKKLSKFLGLRKK